MAVNAARTKLVIFLMRGKIINLQNCRLVFNNNETGWPEDLSLIHEIERIHNDGPTKSFKLLGVLFGEYISFDAHITHLCAKISKSLFCINRIKNFVNQDTSKTLYCAMVRSHLVYCTNVYACANSTSLNKLKIKQKEAIRIIANAGFRDHKARLLCLRS